MYKYKQLQKEKKEVNIKMQDINEQKNNKLRNKIEKIKTLREKNKNLPLRRKIILNENYNDLYEKKYENNLEKTKLLKMEIKNLQMEEEECLNKLNQTKERLNTFGSTEKIYFGKKLKSRKNSEKMSMSSSKYYE